MAAIGRDIIRPMHDFINLVKHRDEQLRSVGEDAYSKEFLKIRIDSEEIRNLPDYSCDVGSRPENMQKNRYRDILPFDQTRAKITPYADDADSDYINASLVKGANNLIGYIATQGPLPETAGDFWQMIAEFDIKTIVMLCDLFEGGKPKCYQYWPEVGTCVQHMHVTIANTYETTPQPHYTTRHFTLTCYGRVTKLQQFHYHGWPDHGTPDEVDPLLDFLEAFRSWQHEKDNAPIVVHCSAGCGRSGTICALDFVRTQLKNKTIPEDFSISNLVSEFRKQRIAMVQSKDQYVLLHQAVAQLFAHYIKTEKMEPLISSERETYKNVHETDTASPTCDINGVTVAPSPCASRDPSFDASLDDETLVAAAPDFAQHAFSHAMSDSGVATSSLNRPRCRRAACTSSTVLSTNDALPSTSSLSGIAQLGIDDDSGDVGLTKNASSSSVFIHEVNMTSSNGDDGALVSNIDSAREQSSDPSVDTNLENTNNLGEFLSTVSRARSSSLNETLTCVSPSSTPTPLFTTSSKIHASPSQTLVDLNQNNAHFDQDSPIELLIRSVDSADDTRPNDS